MYTYRQHSTLADDEYAQNGKTDRIASEPFLEYYRLQQNTHFKQKPGYFFVTAISMDLYFSNVMDHIFPQRNAGQREFFDSTWFSILLVISKE